MKIKHTINGKDINIDQSEQEISMDISKGVDFTAETTFYVNEGQAVIIEQHINPHLKN